MEKIEEAAGESLAEAKKPVRRGNNFPGAQAFCCPGGNKFSNIGVFYLRCFPFPGQMENDRFHFRCRSRENDSKTGPVLKAGEPREYAGRSAVFKGEQIYIFLKSYIFLNTDILLPANQRRRP